MIIYHTPNAKYHAETLFINAVLRQFPDADYPAISYPIGEDCLEKLVHKQSLLNALAHDEYLPNRRKELCIDTLNQCPEKLKVTVNPADISFDMVIATEENIYYWEFHENQHRDLKVSRGSSIYDAETGEAITVPRYVQRLVRDVWRLEHFRPYTIVWKDWFQANQNTYILKLQSDLHENSLPEKFSFRNFYNL